MPEFCIIIDPVPIGGSYRWLEDALRSWLLISAMFDAAAADAELVALA